MMKKFKTWVINFLNKYCNLPVLNEKQEKAIIEGIVEFLFAFKPPKNAPKEVGKMGQDFKDWSVSYVNSYLNVPFLNEEQEKAIINAIFKILFSYYPPKESK